MTGNTPGEQGQVDTPMGRDATTPPIVPPKTTDTLKQILHLTDISEIIEKDGKEYVVVEKDALLSLLNSLDALITTSRDIKINVALTRILADTSEIK